MKDRLRYRKNARPELRGELIATVWRNIGTGFQVRRARRCRIWRWRCGMRDARDRRRRRTQCRRRGTWRRNGSTASRAFRSHFLSALTTTRATRFDNHCDRALRVLAEFGGRDRSIWRWGCLLRRRWNGFKRDGSGCRNWKLHRRDS